MPPHRRPCKYDPAIKVLAIQYFREGKTIKKVQHKLRSPVSRRTLQRWKVLYERTHSIVRDPRTYETLGRPSTFSDEDLDFMLELLDTDPCLYLDEYRDEMYRTTGVWVCIQTIATDLKTRLQMTRKKSRTVHPNQSATKRARFLYKMGALRPDMLVFLDECAVDERYLQRTYGRAKKGYRTRRVRWSRRGKRYSLLPAIFEQGVLAADCQEGGYDRRDFEHFLKHQLFPMMNSYPNPKSVLVMDNASIHKGGRIEELAKERGIRIIYLPPYSPDFNPIEKAFGIFKSNLRRSQCLAQAHPDEKIDLILNKVWEIFTPLLMYKLFVTCGYWI